MNWHPSGGHPPPFAPLPQEFFGGRPQPRQGPPTFTLPNGAPGAGAMPHFNMGPNAFTPLANRPGVPSSYGPPPAMPGAGAAPGASMGGMDATAAGGAVGGPAPLPMPSAGKPPIAPPFAASATGL